MAIFLRDNGVLSMGNKTPVTILHETLNRQGVIANYELIYNGVGTLDPIFKYQVSALGFIAIGDGKTKKEAKHDAAAALLRKMQMKNPEAEGDPDQSTENVDIASPYTGALKENYIGMLEDICSLNKIPYAVFKSISELGPPHARVFKMQCKLSHCTEVAVARTKKQAKHMAAHQMVNRVMAILGDKFIPIVEKIVDYDNPEEPSNLRDIQNGTYHHDMSIPLADLHNLFFFQREDLRVPQEFFDLPKIPLAHFIQLENPKEYLENLIQKLEGICKTMVISETAVREASPTETNAFEKSHFKSENEVKKIADSCGKPSIAKSHLKSENEVKDIADHCVMPSIAKSHFTSDNEVKDITDHCVKPFIDFSMKEEFELLIKKLVADFKLETSDDLTSIADGELGEPTLEVYEEDDDSIETVKESVDAVDGEDDDSIERIEEPISANTGSNEGKIMIFLTIVCPQGEYVFESIESNFEEAERKAAIEALKFLRIMALPTGPYKTEADPFDIFDLF